MDDLRKRKIFLATPAYGGMTTGLYTRSTNDLSALAVHYGVEIKFYYLFNESLIPRARNYCCDEFMRSDCTHLLFIDSDIGFDAKDVMTMLALMSDESAYDILCGPYPKKCISWEKIKQAVDKGIADEDPSILEKFVGDYVFNPVGGTREIPLGEPAEVLESGTGFMMIKRSAMDKFASSFPEKFYRPDHVRTKAFDGTREICTFFDCPIDNKFFWWKEELDAWYKKNPAPKTHEEVMNFLTDYRTSEIGNHYTIRYLSEDYAFCQLMRRIGQRVWLCPWIELTHVGTYMFGGSLAALSSVGASATVDESKIEKMKR